MTLILGKERLEVNEEVFREILVRALYANGLDEPDGVDLLAHRLLTWLDRAGEKPRFDLDRLFDRLKAATEEELRRDYPALHLEADADRAEFLVARPGLYDFVGLYKQRDPRNGTGIVIRTMYAEDHPQYTLIAGRWFVSPEGVEELDREGGASLPPYMEAILEEEGVPLHRPV